MKKCIGVAIGSCLLIFLMCFTKTEKQENVSSILINEVCSRNAAITLENGRFGEDYIELYNTTDQRICLKGWFLSDDSENLDKVCLPEVYIDAHGYVVFYANGKNEQLMDLNFKISDEGEEIFLCNPQGEIADQVFVPTLTMDQTYARISDGNSEWGVFESTFLKSNAEGKRAQLVNLKKPAFSHESGFYSEEFVLTIQADKKQKIYYTTDGSVPTEESTLYTDGIVIKNASDKEGMLATAEKIVLDWKDYTPGNQKIDKANVIRAIAVDDKNNISEIATATFFVDLDQYQDMNVLSLTTEPENLWGSKGLLVTGDDYDRWYLGNEVSSDGIYESTRFEQYQLANFFGSGRAWEIIGNVQLFENSREMLNQMTGIRIQGNTARLESQKGLQLFSRGVYSGNSHFEHKIFEAYDSHAVVIANYPQKAYFMELAENRNLGIQSSKKCAVFLNGEYWYTAALMEKYDATYLEQHYGVNPENVLIVKDRTAVEGEDYYHLYDDLLNYLRDESITNEEKAVTLYEQLDVQSLIDWMCFNLYLGNDDVSYRKNCVCWRTIEPEDGLYGDCKWRWLLYDIDHAAIGAAPESTDFSEFSIISTNRFYWALRTNEHFRKQFVLTAMDMMNSTFCLKEVEAALREWDLDLSYGDDYFLKRPPYMMESLIREFGLSGTVGNVLLSVNNESAGKVYINTIEAEFSQGEWNGQYFTDYPVTVTAVANPGYRFIGWYGDVETAENSIEVAVFENGIALEAVFEKER